MPLKDKNDEIIGAIEVSGSSVKNDDLVAQAGAEIVEAAAYSAAK
jgi:uncharacterized protein GlcG (DUF336 family)